MTAESRVAARGQRPRVLVVEDDPFHASVMKDALAPLDVDAVFVTSAEGALAEARERMPDLVFADYVLPGTDGLSLLVEMGVMRGHPRRVLVTGKDALPSQWGQDIPVLFKPVRAFALQWLVRELLRDHEVGEEEEAA